MAYSTTDSDPDNDSTSRHATADGYPATCAHAATHPDTTGDTYSVQRRCSGHAHAVAHMERRVFEPPPISGKARYADRNRHRLDV